MSKEEAAQLLWILECPTPIMSNATSMTVKAKHELYKLVSIGVADTKETIHEQIHQKMRSDTQILTQNSKKVQALYSQGSMEN